MKCCIKHQQLAVPSHFLSSALSPNHAVHHLFRVGLVLPDHVSICFSCPRRRARSSIASASGHTRGICARRKTA